MATIELSNGLVACVDEDMVDLVSQFKWYAHHRHGLTYARAHVPKCLGFDWPSRAVFMHRLVLELRVPFLQVDHIDFCGLNNVRSNLRVATHAENQHHQRPQNRNGNPPKSRFKGVDAFRSSQRNPWRARIKVNGHRLHLGIFPTEEEAAQAYNEAAERYFGDYAYLNEVEES